jgi:hypothetical protein
MPKDSWKKANFRARYGAVRYVPAQDRDPYPISTDPEKARRRGKKKRKKNRRESRYLIPAGTCCECRIPGTKRWMPHWTLQLAVVDRFLWRNETHHGFRVDDLELKVANGRWAFADKPINPPLADNAPT